jgi:hypothetical protein
MFDAEKKRLTDFLAEDRSGHTWDRVSLRSFSVGPSNKALLISTRSSAPASLSQRREEVGAMSQAELDRDTGKWSIPANRTKNGRIMLASVIIALFAALASACSAYFAYLHQCLPAR